jgi:hypothetical protein
MGRKYYKELNVWSGIDFLRKGVNKRPVNKVMNFQYLEKRGVN